MRSCREVQVKLEEHKYNTAIITIVLDDLKRLGYINDENFALEWATTRAKHHGFGKRRIEQELKKKGIGPELIKKVNSEILTTESELVSASHVAEKKIRSMKNLDQETSRRRLAAFLERKGFSYETIREVLKRRLKQSW